MQSEQQITKRGKSIPRKHTLARPLWYAAIAVSAMITLTVPTTSWGFGIVFDPAIYAKNIQQVQQNIQMLSLKGQPIPIGKCFLIGIQ